MLCLTNALYFLTVIPADPRESGGRAGIQEIQKSLDSRVRGNDDGWRTEFFVEKV